MKKFRENIEIEIKGNESKERLEEALKRFWLDVEKERKNHEKH
jgi:hypothetical protein